MLAETVMAKKKPAQRSLKNKERKSPGFTTKAIRMTEAYADWLERFAKANRMTVAAFVDHAMVEKAKAVGFEPPPERIP